MSTDVLDNRSVAPQEEPRFIVVRVPRKLYADVLKRHGGIESRQKTIERVLEAGDVFLQVQERQAA